MWGPHETLRGATCMNQNEKNVGDFKLFIAAAEAPGKAQRTRMRNREGGVGGWGGTSSRRASNWGLMSDTRWPAGGSRAATTGSTISTLMKDRSRVTTCTLVGNMVCRSHMLL